MSKNKGLGPQGMRIVEAALLRASTGASSNEIAKASGYKISSTSRALGTLMIAEKAVFLRTGKFGQCIWFHVNHMGAFEQYQNEVAQKRVAPPKSRKKRPIAVDQRVNFEDAPIHRTVAACDAIPINPTGPRSVWELAA